jgi:cyclophilin family peptidyl-prolyl cis-trans isomerase
MTKDKKKQRLIIFIAFAIFTFMKRLFLLILFIAFTFTGFSQSRSFTGKPQYQILTKRLGDTLGMINVELFPAIAPLQVSNFDSLVSYSFFDSTAFHRVIPGFMIQGGDPNSKHGPRSTWGMGDPSQPTVPAEFTAARHLRGTLSAARDSDPNSANSQFFICVAPAAWLNGLYSVYGRVVGGMDVVDTIVNAPRDSVDNPYDKIEMFITYTGSNDTVPDAPVHNLPASGSVSASTARVLKWFAESDGIIYHIQVSQDSTFATTFKSVDVGINQYTVTGLSYGKYYWRVNTNNGGQVSNYSSPWNFYVSATGVDNNSQPEKIVVSPNPGNGKFVFSNIPGDCNIEIMDITGRTISSVNTKGNSCTVDISGKAKGLYFYTVSRNDKKVQTGKLLIQ